MHPYQSLPDTHYWSRTIAGRAPENMVVDHAPKFRFSLAEDRFATAGSCFAQHFGRELMARGGQLAIAETAHPLLEGFEHGCGVFSARYGNLYCTTQLRDLFMQACGERPPIFDFARRDDGRWVDMLRPRAVPDGFSSEEECRADRIYHLARVRALMRECSVFVFTLGLTESWLNVHGNYAYGMAPGVAAGAFDPAAHVFRNLSFGECLADLNAAFDLLWRENPAARVLLTVSPVMLVATYESRGILQSSVASKSILRAVADECARTLPRADYFPSYEIVAGPQARGVFFDAGGRDVTEAGVKLVMDTFFRTRMEGAPAPTTIAPVASTDWREQAATVAAAIGAECDEILLDPGR